MSAQWKARWALVNSRPTAPIHAVDHNGEAACNPDIKPEGRPADGDVAWQGNEVGACTICKMVIGTANPKRTQL